MKFLPTKATIAAGAKYFLLGAVVFSIGLVFNFPYERIQSALTRAVDKNTGYHVTIDELSPALPFGFLAEGAHIQNTSLANKGRRFTLTGPLAGVPVDLDLKELKLTVSPISLLLYPFRKKVSFGFRANHALGIFEGESEIGKEDNQFSVETKKFIVQRTIPMGDVDPMLTGTELDVYAEVAIKMNLRGKTDDLSQGDLSNATGSLVLELRKVKIDPPMIKEVRFDKITLNATQENGKLVINSIQLSGPDVTGSASGDIKIESFFPRSRLNLQAKLTLNENADELRTMVTSFGEQVGLRMNEQGVVALKVTGPLSPASRLRLQGY